MTSFLLASTSPRRQDFLTQCYFQFEIVPADVDESYDDTLPVSDIVCALARKKATAVSSLHPEAVVLGADTVVAFDGSILGKPSTNQEAETMLMRLSGKTHSVYTGVSIQRGAKETLFFDKTNVKMRLLTQAEIAMYLASGEALDKAGGYGIQSFGAMLVEAIEGDFYTVAGLPLARTIQALSAYGVYPTVLKK
ncbi:Maf family protein [Shouchella shacheensis]|uniref:Maf family protein n=1 Tax=Shouchella shacheensis TaxID=1649580 RepID=UPI00073FEAFE|nr:Maf family protein [Shouchella shacheensis]